MMSNRRLEIGPPKKQISEEDLERWQELEDLRYRAALIQARISSGLTREDLTAAAGNGAAAASWLKQMEDLSTDPSLAMVRRYCALVGILPQHVIAGIALRPDVGEEEVVDESKSEDGDGDDDAKPDPS